MTGAIDVSVFTLSDPYRVIVDIPEVRFGLDDDAGLKGRGMFTAFRYGQISPGKSRIVLDLAGPVKVDKAFVVPPADNQPARLVIDVVGTSREAFLGVERDYRDARSLEESAKRDRAIVARPVTESGKFNVVLDPGHGGIDTGAKGRAGAVEKVVTLEFAEILAEKLKATGRYNVFFTRTDDRFVALGDRVAIARSHGADLFVSIHANSFRGRSIRGTIVYTVSEGASDALASEIAASENQADAMAGLDLAVENSDEVLDILFDLTKRETRNFEMVFAKNLVKELRQTTGMFKVPYQKAGFKVLTAHDFPSAMIELGFVSNADDEKLLLSDGVAAEDGGFGGSRHRCVFRDAGRAAGRAVTVMLHKEHEKRCAPAKGRGAAVSPQSFPIYDMAEFIHTLGAGAGYATAMPREEFGTGRGLRGI